ncbi:hypothetical protein PG994_006618 [Apiospora phragmitis]|uniref:Uncharacterized protein n=1 Tax=Apiospora phragmitis TaxID=2905665 RepID=A0ABR1VFR1_9PEZI
MQSLSIVDTVDISESEFSISTWSGPSLAIVDLHDLWREETRPYDRGYFPSRAVGLFETWKLEQVAQADGFAHWLCSVLRMCENTEEGVPPTQAWWDARKPVCAQSLRGDRRILTDSNFPPVPSFLRTGYYKYYPQLSTLRRELAAAMAAVPGLAGRLLRWDDYEGPVQSDWAYHFLHWSCRRPRSTYRTARPPVPSALVPCNLTSDAPLEAPWGWTDAMVGSELHHHMGGAEDLWGHELYRIPPANIPASVRNHFTVTLDWWKWAGVVFWDVERAKALQGMGQLGAGNMRTGWLAMPFAY